MHCKDSASFVLFAILHVLIALSPMRRVAAGNSTCRIDLVKREAHCTNLNLLSVPKNLPGNTELLDLSNNKITTLYNSSFLVYKHIRVLAMIDNNISIIESGTFLSLPFLQSLDLSQNFLLPVPRWDMFVSTNLKYIGLETLNISYFSDDLFRVMTSPSILSLDFDYVEEVNWTECHNVSFHYVSLGYNCLEELSEQSFVIDCIVDTLDLTANPITLVSSATISSLKVRNLIMDLVMLPEIELRHLFEGVGSSSTITSLSIKFINLASIRHGQFSALQGKQLHKLDLSHNFLQQLIPKGFENLTGVFELQLNSNQLKAIGPIHFSGMSSLRVLSLRDNGISFINMDNCLWSANLTSLDLSENNLMQAGDHAFNGLKILEVLDLSDNNLNAVANVLFSDLESLNTLILVKCRITEALHFNVSSLKVLNFQDTKEIPPRMLFPDTFQTNTPLLQTINFKDTEIYCPNLWDFNKGISSFYGLHDLRELNLGGTDMRFVFGALFRNLSSLQKLSLDYSQVNVKPCLLEGLFSVEIVSLIGNGILSLPEKFLNDTVQLRELKLAHNDIVFLRSDLFRNIENLTELDLSFNRLVMLDIATFEPILHTLLVLNLEQNQLACNCSLQWLPEWVSERSISLESREETKCAYTGSLKSAKGSQLMDFDPGRECGPQFVLYFLVVASALCATLAIILIYYNRWKISYGLFLCKIHFIGYREIVPREQREDFDYAIQVICHDEDEEWTNEIFRRGLEENLPEYGRLAIGDEALRLGMYYLDSVNRLVKNSFKVVFLISANALRDHMFLLKFRIALDHVNEVQIEKIVLVFLEEIPNADLPFLVRLFLSDNRAYLMWPQDLQGQAYFWEKLGKYMNVNRYCNPLVPP
ncbi:CD180 antigen-like [Diadema setosum]|uniref:CD180 antigen-like n=1 Tax=Diadema setosum TaxID=31175 RepID=UPI003B3B2FF7